MASELLKKGSFDVSYNPNFPRKVKCDLKV